MTKSGAKPRILIAKPGLDGHERGALTLTRALRENGFEVAYTGIRRTPQEIAQQATEFNAEIVGISILSGAHMDLIPRVLGALREAGLEDVPVLVGGIIPDEDRILLLEMGIVAIFGPGSRTDEIAALARSTIGGVRRRGA